LAEAPIVLKEVVVSSPKQTTIQLGERTESRKHLAGWGGYSVGAGGERGLKIESKQFPIYLREIGFFIARNAYDSVLLRLHVRYLDEDLPSSEILPENLFVLFKKNMGLSIMDVSKYNLSIEKPFAISVEWVKAWGDCKGGGCFLQFSVNTSKGTLYMKEASDGKWKKFKPSSPSMFVICSY